MRNKQKKERKKQGDKLGESGSDLPLGFLKLFAASSDAQGRERKGRGKEKKKKKGGEGAKANGHGKRTIWSPLLPRS